YRYICGIAYLPEGRYVIRSSKLCSVFKGLRCFVVSSDNSYSISWRAAHVNIFFSINIASLIWVVAVLENDNEKYHTS
ncbi:hypothetical protein, partial [Schleiferilactobacillus harbinensis]|uniref:hypothetical protein n=1 Tax=Schleiferilactobacillus harbinensis TaxID=304207 RepID=UPI0021A85410